MGGKRKRAGTRSKAKTMEEFSVVVGLSRPTVSKYFHDPNSVRPSTRTRIEDALKTVEFHPNIFAVNLNRRRKRIIGLIVPDPMDQFYMALAARIEAIASEAGYLVLQLNSNGQPETEERAIATIASMDVGGALIAALGAKSHVAELKALSRRTPLVFVDSPLDDNESFVGTNNLQTVPLIVDYLCRSGEPPAFFDMPLSTYNGERRREAYAATMERLGLRPSFVKLGDAQHWDFEAIAYDAARTALRSSGLPSRTLLCANDRVAFGVIAAISETGASIGIGRDYRVAGHDNQRFSAYTSPPLTTVAQDVERMSRVAFELLVDKMDQADGVAGPGRKRAPRALLNGELVLRQSA